MPWKYIQYEYPVEFTINHVMVWASASLNAYVGYSRDGITWNYLKAQASHALSSGSLLEASNEADAQENYWTTGISGDGQLADALWPYMRQAKICRLYFSTSPVTIHELKFWVYVIADEIVAGTLRLATGLTIASTQDPNNAVIMDSSGIRAYAGSVQKLNITPAGITIYGGSGYVNLTDKPTSLSGINSGEGTKLSGIAAGATVGAAWASNLTGIPATLATPSGDGLYLGSSYMGFYKSSAWKVYIDNSGNLVLGDIAGGNAGLTWSQSAGTLTINGSIKGGCTDYFTGVGFFLGYSTTMTPSAYKFFAGDPNGKNIRWNGAGLYVNGDIIATGNIVNQAVTRGAEYINNSAIAFSGTEIEIGSITITTNTASDYVWLWGRAFTIVSPFYNDGKGGVEIGSIYRIRRNSISGPIVDQWSFSPFFDDMSAPYTLMGISQPGAAGDIVFKLTAQAPYSSLTQNGQAAYRLLMGLSKSK